MKNYKNIFRILIGTVCFQLSMTGCSDDFLTPIRYHFMNLQ